jgi:thiamine pyrophosphate-dependent acetolactate synthase large subunit-like protein
VSKRVSELIVDTLVKAGVRHYFGIPGVDSLHLHRSLSEYPSISNVVVRNEATAGFAADAFFRVSGNLAACVTTGGPGVAYAAVALGEATASSSAFLHLATARSTVERESSRHRGIPHWFAEQDEAVTRLAKRTYVLAHTEDIEGGLLDALVDVQSVPHQPVAVEIAKHLLPLTGREDGDARKRHNDASAPVTSLGPLDLTSLDNAADVIKSSKRPLLWCGTGAIAAGKRVVDFAAAIDAPILVSLSAKRRFPHGDHPLLVNFPLHEPPVSRLISGSDCVIVLGSDLDLMSIPADLHVARVIRVDLDPNIATVAEDELHLCLDVADSVDHWLSLGLTARRAETGADRARVANETTVAGLARGDNCDGWEFVSLLDRELGHDAVVVCDMAVAGYWAAGYLPLSRERSIVYPMGWGTLGFGLGAAIGASFARPQSRTVLISGDAGIQYFLGELGTVREHSLPITILVIDDGGYGMLRAAGKELLDTPLSFALVGPKPSKLGAAFDIPVYEARVGSIEAENALIMGLSAEGPSIVWLRGKLTPPIMSMLFRRDS